ncbi:MAG: hypothetical protein K0S29_734 [Gammaproteobacteria bacterium]|jgi:beta-N-acetylhexosaminidase|nr:hypothetical protein [Gammaproteobacteria bacterium]
MLSGPLIVGIAGIELSYSEKEMLKHPLISGVILFSRNYQSPEQLSRLTQSIHELREPKLLISVDQEGGRVQRFRSGFSLLPAAGSIGKLYDKDPVLGLKMAGSMAELMALELRSCGVDLSFAPVLDIDNGQSKVIGNRGFHSDPVIVAELGKAYVNGMKKAGMAAVAKHYPGHGSVINDTHLESASDPRPLTEIEQKDLIPFKSLVEAGIAGIMAAHVSYGQVDQHPAGFSKIWLQEILRQKLHFKGVIFSDDLGMMAAKQYGNIIQTVKAALNAGCDRVLLCNEPDAVSEVLAGLTDYKLTQTNTILQAYGQSYYTWNTLSQQLRWQELHKELETYFS